MSQIFSKKLLQDNYYRLNPRMNRDISMDDVKAIDYLTKLAKEYDMTECVSWINDKWNKI